MDQMEKIYQELTGINIEEQIHLWTERGKGYYGEFLVFHELYRKIPGFCKILMNLQIPTYNGKSTEIDLLMIHETGLYVFEVKHYKGTIYGRTTEDHWTQYFRTSKNNSFHNPVKQNQYHINAIRKKYPGIPVHSFIVFTSPSCDLRVDGIIPDTTICTLLEMCSRFKKVCDNKPNVMNLIQIDSLFGELKEFSPLMNEIVTVSGEAIPFYRYAEILKIDFQEALKENAKKVKKSKFLSLVACIIFSFLMLIVIGHISIEAEEKVFAAKQELAALSQKFEHVVEFNNSNIKFSENLVVVSDVILEPSPDIDNTVNFSCTLTCVGSNYGVSVGGEAAIIVILKDGSVKEYDLWNETYPFSSAVRLGSLLSPNGKIGVHEFYDIDVSEISYIKLINLGVWSLNNYSREDIASGYEVELYCNEETKLYP